MKRNRSSISKARSYAEIGEYWDTHDLSNVWGRDEKGKIRRCSGTRSDLLPQ